MSRPRAGALAFVLSLASVGCAGFGAMLAPPDDLEDYRAFRVAAAEGTRLSRAKRYIDRHPKGRFVDEVKAAFNEEEPRHFEQSQGSKDLLRSYLADLPDGPHAEAALALLVSFGTSMKDAELKDLARRVRNDDAKLEAAAVQRRAVGATILAALGVLVDDDVYGVPVAQVPPKLRALLLGRGASTWGTVPPRREEDYFFLLPTRPERESRLLTLEFALELDSNKRVVGAKLAGNDMLVRWMEADQIVALDSASDDDRNEAQIHTMARIEGALERRFPVASCPDLRRDRELYHRSCAGWEAVVLAGVRAGDKDVIILRAPRGTKAVPAPRKRPD